MLFDKFNGMGYMRHHAIVVTGIEYDQPETVQDIRVARAQCENIVKGSCVRVSEVTPKVMNGYRSFLVAPDGSKEGWSDSKEGDDVRCKIISFLNSTRYSDGSSSLGWVEVQFDDDEKDTRIIHDSDEPL